MLGWKLYCDGWQQLNVNHIGSRNPIHTLVDVVEDLGVGGNKLLKVVKRVIQHTVEIYVYIYIYFYGMLYIYIYIYFYGMLYYTFE